MGATMVRLAAVTAVLLTGGSVAAQLPTAPPPHPPLAEVVKEYQRLGLPLPPPQAELVRIECWQGETDENGVYRSHEAYLLGFRLAPTHPGADPRYQIGYGRWYDEMWYDPRDVMRAEPTRDALRLVELDGEEYLALAVQCKLRGWDELAASLYALAWEQFSTRDNLYDAIQALRERAFSAWVGRLKEPGSDRKEILVHLKKLVDENDSLRDPHTGQLLSQLETTVFHPKAKPGTVEARIDGLTEYFDYPLDPTAVPDRESYWKLAGLGFDAVPALIEHVSDARLTRAWSYGFNFRSAHDLAVGHLCSRLLFDLSGRSIGGGYWELRGDYLDPEEARKWFAAAKKIGEEKWLLDHAIPKDDGGTITNQEGRPENLIVRVIGAKYPKRLPEVYRAILRKPASPWLRDFVDEIAASKLTREQKIALLEEGVAHDHIDHHRYALEGLAAVDMVAFRKHLLQSLRLGASQQPIPLYSIDLSLIERANSPECWDAYAALTKRQPFSERMAIIMWVGKLDPPDKPDPFRRERIRFLMQFLDDRTAEKLEDDDTWNMVEVRDWAAGRLAGVLRFHVKRRAGDYMVEHNPDRGPLSRLIFREWVRQAAGRELARLGK